MCQPTNQFQNEVLFGFDAMLRVTRTVMLNLYLSINIQLFILCIISIVTIDIK